MNDFFKDTLFSIWNKDFTGGQLTGALMIILLAIVLYYFVIYKLVPYYFANERLKTWKEENVSRIIKNIFYLLAIWGVIWALDINEILESATSFSFVFRISTLVEALLIFQIARLADWVFLKILLYNYYRTRNEGDQPKENEIELSAGEIDGSSSVHYVVYALAILMILNVFQFDYSFFRDSQYSFNISNIFYAIFLFLLAQLIAWILTQLILFSYYKKKKVNVGSQYAINQLLKYVIYVIAIFMALESFGIKMTVIWGGAAALLVGVGLGLQQTFNDLISGVILLFERTIEVGNVVDINGMVGTVKAIGIRTSIVETRDNITVIVPNSKLIVDTMNNWSQFDDKVRFKIGVGVAYGTDTALVKNLLIQVAKDNVYVLSKPGPSVRFVDFGNSSLDFELIFWSRNFIVIEDIKSDLRFEVDRLFRENNITIPFPQRDLWIKKEGTGEKEE